MKKDAYFQRGSFLEYFLIICGLALLIFLVIHPEPNIYLESLGFLGKALLSLHEHHYQKLYYLMIWAIAVHIVETIYCVKLVVGLGMTPPTILKWTFQTIILGGFSLRRLINHRNTKNNKNCWTKIFWNPHNYVFKYNYM